MSAAILPFHTTAAPIPLFRGIEREVTLLSDWKQKRLNKLKDINKTIVFKFDGVKQLGSDSGLIGGMTPGLSVRYRLQKEQDGLTLILYGAGWSSAVPIRCDGFVIDGLSTSEINIDPLDGKITDYLLQRHMAQAPWDAFVGPTL
jgi:hypothetical protein